LSEDCDTEPFGNFQNSFYHTFNMGVMGDFDTEYLDLSGSPWIARTLYLLMCIIVPVIALNALIALLGDSFERVKDESEANIRWDEQS
jgi:hypothetical protein